jgi:hypothetical protein
MSLHNTVESGLKQSHQIPKMCTTDVGKQVLCPRCGLPGILDAKTFGRKTPGTSKVYFCVRHWLPGERKILWHYVGERLNG